MKYPTLLIYLGVCMRLLSESALVVLTLYLMRKWYGDEVKKSELGYEVGRLYGISNRTMYKVLRDLRKVGIVDVREDGKSHRVRLTKKGLELARLLAEVEKYSPSSRYPLDLG